MAVAKVGTDVTYTGVSASSHTIAPTYAPGAGSDRLVVIRIVWASLASISDISWGASSVTGGQITLESSVTAAGASNRKAFVYICKESNFQSGSDIIVTTSSSIAIRTIVSCASGADQTSPVPSQVTDSGSAATTGSTAITVPSGGAAFSAYTRSYASNEAVSYDSANWTEDFSGAQSTNWVYRGWYTATTGSQNPSPSWTTSASFAMATIAISASSGTPPVLMGASVF